MRGTWVVFGGLALAGAVHSQEQAPPPDLQAEVERLQRELDQLRERLEAQAPAPEPAPPPAEDTSSLDELPVKVDLAFGEGLTVTAPDDSFSLNFRARIQLRFTQVEDAQHESSSTFEVRRARLVFKGHALTRDLSYYIQLSFANQDNEPDLRLPLRDAYLTWSGLRDLNVRAGQMKVPFNPQRLTGSSSLQLVDRSLVNAELTLDRDVGVQVFSSDLFGLGDRLGYHLGVFGGDGRNRLSDSGGLLFVARLHLTPFGKFDLDEGDLGRRDTPSLMLGAAAAHNAHTNRQRSTLGATFLGGRRVDYFHAEADAHFKWQGFSLRSEAIMRWGEERLLRAVNGVQEPTRSAWGWFVQAGFMITDHIELAARHGELRPLRRLSAVTLSRESGGGISWYIRGHDLKLQADYFRLWGERLEDGDHQVRVQIQLYI